MNVSTLRFLLFCSASIVFVLNSVAFLSPAWFLNEKSVRELQTSSKFTLDGRTFSLPKWNAISRKNDTANLGVPMPTKKSDVPNGRKRTTRSPESSTARVLFGRAKRDMPEIFGSNQPHNSSQTKISIKPQRNEHNNPAPTEDASTGTTPAITEGAANTRIHVPAAFSTKAPTENDSNMPRPIPDPSFTNIDDSDDVDQLVLPTPTSSKGSAQAREESNPSANDRAGQYSSADYSKIYLSAGLWYCRLCVHGNDWMMTSDDKMADITQWCTHYVRTDAEDFDRQERVDEVRIEASVALAFSIAALVTSSCACLSKRHLAVRTTLSLIFLLITGVALAVPVIHILQFHWLKKNMLVRQRNWKDLIASPHSDHDLFDHWSVILEAVACSVALVTVLLSSVVCYSTRQSRKSVSLSDLEKKNDSWKMGGPKKQELRANWIYSIDKTSMTSETVIPVPDVDDDGADSLLDVNDIKHYDVIVSDAGSVSSAKDGGTEIEKPDTEEKDEMQDV